MAMSELGTYKDVKHAKRVFMPEGVSMTEWLSRRLGDVVEVRPLKGSCNIVTVALRGQLVREHHALVSLDSFLM